MTNHDTTPVTPEPIDAVPLALLVLEGLGQSVDQLAAQLKDAVIVDDIGMRCVAAATARRMFTERAEAEARAEVVQRRNLERAQAAQEQALAALPKGIRPPAGLEDVPALALMRAAETEKSLDAANRRTDEYMAGAASLTYHPIRWEDEE